MTPDRTIYVFLRQDLPPAVRVVQAIHAFDFMRKQVGYRAEEHPAVILLDGGSSEKSLLRIQRELSSVITVVPYTDPDFDFGVSSLATAPLTEEERVHVMNYRLHNDKFFISYIPRGAAETQASASVPSEEPILPL